MNDYESCSWCLTEVPDSELVELPDGARVCPPCKREADQEAADSRLPGTTR